MFVAVALAAGTFFITMHYTNTPKKEVAAIVPVVEPKVQIKEAPTSDIYTAKTDIPIGAVITQDMLDLQPWPKNLVLPDMVLVQPPHPDDLIKMVARTPFLKGEPIMLNRLANANDPSFIAASLAEGMRLVTIAVDVVSGVGGFLFPGDRVDVLLTHDDIEPTNSYDTSVSSPNAPPKKDAPKKQVTELLMTNVRVLATNQKNTAHSGDALTIPTTVSLEVSPSDAQKLKLAENGNGRLSLALRSLKNRDAENGEVPPTKLSDLTIYKEKGATVSDISEVKVVRGINTEAVEVSKP